MFIKPGVALKMMESPLGHWARQGCLNFFRGPVERRNLVTVDSTVLFSLHSVIFMG